MAHDIFLKLAGIDGESQDASHTGEIEVLRWSWQVTQASNMHSGSGGGAGKALVDDLNLEHYVDRASPNLMKYCLTGKHMEAATLVMRKAGGAPLEYFRITMQDVIVTQVNPAGVDTMSRMRERVSLSFARVRQDYVVQSREGTSAGTISAAYDIRANREL